MRDNNLKTECPGEDQLLDLHYGELNSIESQELEKHLSDCAHCSVLKATFASIGTSFEMVREEIGGLQIERTPVTKNDGIIERILGAFRPLSVRPIIATSLGVVITFALGTYIVTTNGTQSNVTSVASPTDSIISSGSPALGSESKSDANSDSSDSETTVTVPRSEEIRLAYVEPQMEDGVRLTDILSELE